MQVLLEGLHLLVCCLVAGSGGSSMCRGGPQGVGVQAGAGAAADLPLLVIFLVCRRVGCCGGSLVLEVFEGRCFRLSVSTRSDPWLLVPYLWRRAGRISRCVGGPSEGWGSLPCLLLCSGDGPT